MGKMSRRRRARVVFPLEEHPLMPMMIAFRSSIFADFVNVALDVGDRPWLGAAFSDPEKKVFLWGMSGVRGHAM